MTFLEAAIEILRNAAEPLHFAEVAKRAVAENLLSHVGRDPEAAMRSCLNSASRMGNDDEPPLIMRDKPGFYVVRAGAALPPSPPRPAPPIVVAPTRAVPSRAPTPAVPAARDGGRRHSENPRSSQGMDGKSKVRSRRRGAAAEGEPEQAAAVETAESASDASMARPSRSVEFVAPEGSGLDGVTDVALVMANAMSRLVEERPELRHELDAMQQQAEPTRARDAEREPSRDRDRDRDRDRERAATRDDRGLDDRGGRRRRRRRRRGKRVEWTGGAEARPATAADRLLDEVAGVLEAAGARSLHVRQIAEQLAAKGVLGGEISEIERAATAMLLIDVKTHGRASRFAARGDARYQLQGTRVPDRAAKAEAALREALREVEQETQAQFVQWLQSLGARALESLVRIWLRTEGYPLQASLPPGRGVGRLVVEDAEAEDEDQRLLAVIVPRRTALDPKAWEGEPERHGCAGVLLFAMADGGEEVVPDARVIGAGELASWLREHGIGVQKLRFDVTVLDPTVIESVAGLDS